MAQIATFDAQADTNRKVNQTTVPTFTASIWRSSWVDVRTYRRLTLLLAMDQPSAGNGVLIEQSLSDSPSTDSDAHDYTEDTTEQRTNPVTGQVYHHSGMTVERIGRYARLVVKHNGVAPTVFKAALIGAGIT